MHTLLVLFALTSAPRMEVRSVNPIVGDLSAIMGYTPSLDELPFDEAHRARVRGHLRFIHDVLAARDMRDIAPGMQAARAENLERLRRYADAGHFPLDDDHPDAVRPTFVDSRGEICAVGFLFAADRGRHAAERVARQHKYAYITEIDDPELVAWQRTSGLSLFELQLVQPRCDGWGGTLGVELARFPL